MAAMEIDRYKNRLLDGQTVASSGSLQTLQTLLDHDTTGMEKGLEEPWRGAEAYHFWLLAQRQLYSGAVDAALRTVTI